MPDILQLKDFVITRLHVDWHEPGTPLPVSSLRQQISFDYDVLRKKDAPRSFVLRLRMRLGSNTSKSKAGYEITSEIMGLFEFPDTMDDKQMNGLVRINGGTILYGVLRGELAAFTGSFPGGKFILPAVCMQDVVAGIEKRKHASRKKTKSQPKPT